MSERKLYWRAPVWKRELSHKTLRNKEKSFVLSTTSKWIDERNRRNQVFLSSHHIQKACLKARTFTKSWEIKKNRSFCPPPANWWQKSSKSSISQQVTTIFKRPVWKRELSHKTLRNQEKSFVLSTTSKGIDERNRRNQAFLSSPPYSKGPFESPNFLTKPWEIKKNRGNQAFLSSPYSKGLFEIPNFPTKPWEIKKNCSFCPPTTKELMTEIVEIKHFSAAHHHIQTSTNIKRIDERNRGNQKNPEKSRIIVRFVHHRQSNKQKKKLNVRGKVDVIYFQKKEPVFFQRLKRNCLMLSETDGIKVWKLLVAGWRQRWDLLF